MIHEKDLVIIGDEAWLPDELERTLERKRRRARYDRERYLRMPESEHERRRERARRWAAEHPERMRENRRNHAQRKHARRPKLHVVASLHSLRCTGPTKATGCRCRKQLVVRRYSGVDLLASEVDES